MISIAYINGAEWANLLNKQLTGRIYLQSKYMQIYHFSLFGNLVDSSIVLDNTYIRCVLLYGIVGTIIYYYIFNRAIYFSSKEKNRLLTIILIVILLYGIMEMHIIRPGLDIFLLYFPTELIINHGKQKNKIYK